MSAAQIRAARALLGWSQVKLAEVAGVSEPTIKRLEGGKIIVSKDIQLRIQSCLESAGVIFIERNGEGEGVRMKKYDGITSQA